MGTNGELIFAEKMSTVDELGFVGSITNIDKNLIFSLLRAKIIPVIAPL
ncbi:MAG: acetylglutamate kinase, partial [Candidatus Omnitrophota bacterium]